MTLPPAIEKTRPLESPQIDTSTLSNYRDFRLVHTTLELKVDFDSKVLRGEVTYELERVSDTKKVMLDSSELVVQKVFIDDEEARFNFDEKLAILGSRLVIEPENGKLAEKFKLRCCYETMAGGSAIQWLDEHQTSGQKYVYNQLEPIHGRAFVPSFDTPAVKSTLNVRISSPHRVVFSGIEDEDSGLDGVYSFTQRIPIPTYLFGFASGDIVSADLGPRTKVFAEPHLLEDATKEFTGDVERFIDIAEDLIFEYEWGNYSILVNPSSYPFGGMEYPNITFATPTIVTRDKSNIDVIAHELAHSWSGNLVTNASWGHMWLNEGWTVYLERRITGVVHGEPTRHLAFLVGLTNLQLSLESLENKSLTRLINTADETVNPDDLIQLTAYEKGSCFLFHLENALGGTTAFDPFIKHYFKKFAGKSLDSWQFLDTLFEFFEAKRDILDSIDWETWLFGTGMPPSQKFITNLADEVYALAEKWFANAGKFSEASQFEQEFSISDISHFNIDQLQMFLNSIAQSSSKTDPSFSWSDYPVAAQAFLNIYGDIILHSHNAEIVYRTFLFQIIAHIESSYQLAAEWLGTVGRIKYVRPLYIALASADRQLALDTYSKYRNTYHPICQAAVENSLGIK